ncbi:MAG TPA: hypothetical protein VN930_00415, partial [Xanthobacteraceae bacterium]|nr:hypothetical protein [Xanthobacteraceae bacterium]
LGVPPGFAPFLSGLTYTTGRESIGSTKNYSEQKLNTKFAPWRIRLPRAMRFSHGRYALAAEPPRRACIM